MFLLITVLTLSEIFSLILNIFQGVLSEKTINVQIPILPVDIDAKKTRKTFQTLHIIFFLMLNCEFFIVMTIYGSKLL